jgi:AcrR family transcriptional regulator
MGRPRLIDDETLLAIAREVFVRDGAFGSTREIARRAGVSEAALFKRFSTKAELFVAALAPPVIDIDALVKEAQALGDAREGIAFVAEQVLEFFRQALPVIFPLLRNPLIGPDAVHRHFGKGQAGKLVKAIARYLQNEAQEGRIGPVNPFAAAALLVASMHSVAQVEIMGFHEGMIPSDGVALLLDTMWRGLKPSPSSRIDGKPRQQTNHPVKPPQRKGRKRT